YRMCKQISKWQRKSFSNLIKNGQFEITEGQSKAPNFVSFSCGRDFEEQVLSILSLIHWVGRPQSWTIYSDGSHSEQQIQILSSLGSFIRVKLWNTNILSLFDYKKCLTEYASQHAMGKRICAYSTHIIDCPTIFLDSDV
ncbi:hypothetical protein AAHH59_10675, partial [Pediococcus acidilactici]|uniref:hypothetical protein n=1 Tax=Pediococcus acidilactici TaxID=1254 RepID=UPI00318E13A8